MCDGRSTDGGMLALRVDIEPYEKDFPSAKVMAGGVNVERATQIRITVPLHAYSSCAEKFYKALGEYAGEKHSLEACVEHVLLSPSDLTQEQLDRIVDDLLA